MFGLGVSDSFLLEDVTDPVAVSMFSNTDDYDLANDEEELDGDDYCDDDFDYGDDEDDYEYEEYDGEDMVSYSINPDELIDDDNIDVLTTDVNEDIEIDNDVSDEDGEIIDIVDGIYL